MQKISKTPVNYSVCKTVDQKEILNRVQNDSYEDFAVCHPCKTADHEEILNRVQNDSYRDLDCSNSCKVVDMKKIKTSRKKAAFTLAETLIAIGIIGVVSALTIPTLIKNYQKRVIETNLKKTFAELQSVIKQSELDNGPFEGWDYTLGYPAFAKTYITPYMKIRQCKSGECFAKEHHNGYYDVWRLANTGETTTGGVWCIMPKYITLDGRHIGIMPYTYTTIRKSVVFAVDVNGSAGRSVLGEDVFFMSMIYADGKKKIFAMSSGHFYGWNDTTLKAKCYARDSESSYCGDVIRRNGWKFPKDYPFFK